MAKKRKLEQDIVKNKWAYIEIDTADPAYKVILGGDTAWFDTVAQVREWAEGFAPGSYEHQIQ